MSPFLDYNNGFVSYGSQHITVIILMVVLAIGLPLLAKRYFSSQQQLWTSRLMAILISTWVILYDLILIYLGKFNYQTDLPLDICNLMGLLLPFLMWKPNQRIFPYLYFWILTGTTQAIFAPHLYNAFPNFIFIKYWIVHAGLFVFIIYVAVVWQFSLRWKDLWRAFLALQVYVVSVFLIDKLIGANYVYVVQKPPTASVLDYLGPWPVYILAAEVIALFSSFLVFLPYLRTVQRESPSKQL